LPHIDKLEMIIAPAHEISEWMRFGARIRCVGDEEGRANGSLTAVD
jgi:hypothetical protein